MKDRAERDVRGSVLLTPAGASLRSSFTARSGASRAARHASLEKTCFCPGTKARFFVVPVAGVEPARLLCRGILRLVSHTEDSGSTRNYRFKTY